MTPENFAYWLQGYFELIDDGLPLTNTQVEIIKDHLALVFTKVTPDRTNNVEDDIKDEGKIDLEFPLDEWKKLIKELEEKNKNPWINPIPQWPQNPTYPFYDTNKPSWPTYPEIICKVDTKACSDIPDFNIEAPKFDTVTESFKPTSIKDIVKNKTFC